MKLSLAPLILAVALAGCGQAKETRVTDAWVRLAAAPGRPAAAYFTLKGGPADATLISVTSPVVIRSEMHESMAHGTTMTMAPIQQVALPAKGEVRFAPGGKHVMLFDMNPAIKPGSIVSLVFTFADGLKIEYGAKSIAAGDPPPK
ncbi:copper chaperone PCu(A)C [soil metagenome]